MFNILSIIVFIMITTVKVSSMPFNISNNNTYEVYQNDCSRVSNIVDISKTYPNIVLQKNYDIGRCSGSCIVTKKKIINGKEVLEKVTKNCIPINFHFLQIYLYNHETNKINSFEIHEIVVNECGCKF